MAVDDLHGCTVGDSLANGAELRELLLCDRGEAPLLAHDNLLAAGELELGTAEGLSGNTCVLVLAADRHEDLANADTSSGTDGLTEGTTHTGLETIGTCARQHLVDAEHVEGVCADAEVEGVLTCRLGQELVGADTGCLKCLRRDLLILKREHVHAAGEVIDVCLLAAQIERADLGVGDTTAVARLDVRLTVGNAVAASGAAAHCDWSK